VARSSLSDACGFELTVFVGLVGCSSTDDYLEHVSPAPRHQWAHRQGHDRTAGRSLGPRRSKGDQKEREQDTSCSCDLCVPTATEGNEFLASASRVVTQLLGHAQECWLFCTPPRPECRRGWRWRERTARSPKPRATSTQSEIEPVPADRGNERLVLPPTSGQA